jgi:hypothetical protein
MNSLVILIQQLTDLRQLRTLDLEFKYAVSIDVGARFVSSDIDTWNRLYATLGIQLSIP